MVRVEDEDRPGARGEEVAEQALGSGVAGDKAQGGDTGQTSSVGGGGIMPLYGASPFD